LRGHLQEFGLQKFGLIAAKGIHRVEDLIALARTDAGLPQEAKQAVEILTWHGEQLDAKIDALEKKIAQASAKNPTSRLLNEVPAIGPLIAPAMTASVPDPSVFKSGSDFSASLGLTPSQHSSGGKEKLGAITKKSNRYLPKTLVVGGASVLRVATNTRAPWPSGSLR
jgi:transposase